MPAARRLATLALCAGLSGCAGTAPLLHPAHVLPEGEVTAAAGVVGQIAAGSGASTIQQARETTVAGLAPVADADERYRKGALAIATLTPGVSPFVSGRVGLGYGSEGGLTYTGHDLRVDGRHAFGDETWALSVGLGAQARLVRGTEEDHAALQGLGLAHASGYGLDVPVLVGWQSKAELFSIWGGARGGYEKLGGSIDLGGTSGSPQGLGLSGSRLWGGGVLGLSGGFRHVFVALELDAFYQRASASMGEASTSVSGFTLTPSGALRVRF